MTIGNQFNPLTNIDMKGFFKNNYIDFEDLFRKNTEVELALTGIIKDINIMKNAIFLKLINFDNFIDTHKVYINFKDSGDFEK